MEEMEDTYLIEAEFVFISYLPTKLKVGMTFVSKVTVGVPEVQYNYFTLETLPEDPDLFMSLYGAPVRVFLLSTDGNEEIIALGKEIGYIDDMSIENEINPVPITNTIMNVILNDYEGYVDVVCDEDGHPVRYEDNKIILSYLCESDEDEEE